MEVILNQKDKTLFVRDNYKFCFQKYLKKRSCGRTYVATGRTEERMIVYTQLSRTKDGLPLSASTDFSLEANATIKESKKYVKMLAYRAPHLPERAFLRLSAVSLYLTSYLGVSYIAMSESNYPPPLAFAFLKELMSLFLQSFHPVRVNSAKRPFEFIQFDEVIHRIRESFNKPQALTSKINYSELEMELRLRPPRQLMLTDVEPQKNSLRFDSRHPPLSVGPYPKLEPLSVFAWPVILLSVLLVLVGVYRGISSLQNSNLEDYDGPSPIVGILYLCESLLRLYQTYLLLAQCRWRAVGSWASGVALLLFIFVLWEVRDPSQHAVFVTSTLAVLTATNLRPPRLQSPHHHV